MDTFCRILHLNGLAELVELEAKGTVVTVHPIVGSFRAKQEVSSRVDTVLRRAGYKSRVSGYTVATAWTL
jgi:hypothetical protein